MSPQLTVAGLLRSRPDAIGLTLELLSGRDGLERAISSPHIQKTGLALAGFHEYLQPGRVLVFGESEVRYLESLAETRSSRLAAASRADRGFRALSGAAAADGGRHADGDRENRRAARKRPCRARSRPRRVDGHPQPGRIDHR